MQNPFETLLRATHDAKRHGVAMQHKLLLYWGSMLLAVFAVLMIVLSVAGVFSGSGEKLQQALTLQHNNTVMELNEQINTLTAQGITISGQASNTLNQLLYTESTQLLNDNPDALREVERELYAVLNTALRSSACNGAYLVIDATTNTAAQGAEYSRAGLYLRFANLNAKHAVDQDVTLYRGIPDVARENRLELHNRWKMEFDISRMAGYTELMSSQSGKLADHCVWTQRVRLTDTWEDMVLLMVPIRGGGGVRGICGLELSDLYLRLSYPSQESQFGNMVTVIAPMDDNLLLLSEGMTGGLEGIYLDGEEDLRVTHGRKFHTYTGANGTYLGVHTKLDMDVFGGVSMYAVTLVSEAGYHHAMALERAMWLIGSLVFLTLMLTVCVILSRRFVRPIVSGLDAIRDDVTEAPARTGISEIDSLLTLLQGKLQKDGGELPADIAELFDDFARRAAQLTATERTILQYYADGHEVSDVAELVFISIHTIRKHNANMYRKLEVGSRDELMLYIELFRRSGRLNEILHMQKQEP